MTSNSAVEQSGSVTPGNIVVWDTTGVVSDSGFNISTMLASITFSLSLKSPVFQSGNVTPGHIPIWATNGVIQDSGVPFTPTGAVNVIQFGAVGDGVTDDTAAIQAAHNAANVVYYPVPPVKYNITTIKLPNGAEIRGFGAGDGASSTYGAPRSFISATTSAYAYTFDNTNPATEIIGPRFFDIYLEAQNGVRLNSPANGQPGFGGTQGYINDASFRRCSIVQKGGGGGGTGTGIQASIAFHLEIIEQTEVFNFSKNIDIYFSDLVHIANCRINGGGASNIAFTSINTFGNIALVEHCDLLACRTGAEAHVVSGNYDITLRSNFIEQAAGEGTGMTAAIHIKDNTQAFWIEDNEITMPVACAANWLVVDDLTAGNVNIITNNRITLSTPALFGGGLGMKAFSGGGASRNICIHHGNTFENGIPQATYPRSSLALTGFVNNDVLGLWTSGLIGTVSPTSGSMLARDQGLTSYIKSDGLAVPPTGGAGTNVWFTDPETTLIGTFAVSILMYADAAQTPTIRTADNFTPTGALFSAAVALVPTWYEVTAGTAISTSLQVLVNNHTVGGSNTIHILAILVRKVQPKLDPSFTVATLPTPIAPARATVTDATQTLTAGIGAVVAGSGGNVVPVYYDGTNWRIG
jgi:hypothetical protein